MASLEEFTNEHFGFKLSTSSQGISVFDQLPYESIKDRNVKLLAISNTKGYFACSNLTSIVLAKTDELSKISGDETSVDWPRIEGFTDVTHVYFSNEGTRLYILDDGHVKYTDQFDNVTRDSFTNIESPSKIVSVLPSPTDSDLLTLTDNGDLIHRNKTISAHVEAFSWSLDGKHIVYSNGKEVNVTPSSQPGSANHSIAMVEDGQRAFTCTEIGLLSFLVVFGSNENDPDDQDYETKVIVCNSSYEVIETYDSFIADPFGAARIGTYYIESLHDWWFKGQILSFITSSKTTEISTIESGGESQPKSLLHMNDTDKALFPMNEETDEDVSSVGIAFDLTDIDVTIENPCTGVDSTKGTLPKLWSLTDEGNLISWWVFESNLLKDSKLTIDGPIQHVKHNSQSNMVPSSTTAGATAIAPDAKPSALGSVSENLSSPITQSSSKPEASSGFGNSGFGNSGFGGSGFGSTGNTGFGSSGFGSAGFGSAGFGKSAFGKTTTGDSISPAPESTEKVTGGPTSFAKVDSTPGSFGKSGFGSSGFGAQSSSFGTSGFSNSTVSSGFGNSSNKAVPFGSSGNKPSPFGSSSNKASPFGSTSEKPNPFGSSENKGGPFGSSDKSNPFAPSTNKASPFGSGTEQSSPFGTSKNKPSPFASISDKKIPFESSTNKPSPFASISDKKSPFESSPDKSSPFASLSDKKSPFEASTNKPSPFASLSDKKSPFEASTNKSSPFASLSDKKNPFETATNNAVPFGSVPGKPSAFGSSSNKSSLFGYLGTSSDKSSLISGEAEKPNPFGSSANKASPFGSALSNSNPLISTAEKSSPAEVTANKTSPFASLSEKPSPFGSSVEKPALGSHSDVSSPFGNTGSLHVSSNKASPFGSFGNPSTISSAPMKDSPLDTSANESTDSVSKQLDKQDSTNTQHKSIEVPTTSKLEKTSNHVVSENEKNAPLEGKVGVNEPVFSMANSFSSLGTTSLNPPSSRADSKLEKNTELDTYATTSPLGTPNIESENSSLDGSSNESSEDEQFTEINHEEAKMKSPSFEIVNKNEFLASSSSTDHASTKIPDESVISDEEYELEAVTPCENFQRFSGISPNAPAPNANNPISQKLSDIYHNTSGVLKVLENNVQILVRHIDELENRKSDSYLNEEALDLPEVWGITTVNDSIPTITEEFADEIGVFIESQNSQNSKLSSLTRQIEESNVERIKVGRILSQLATLSSGSSSYKILRSRPLDFQNENLQRRIRVKLADIEKKLQELKSKMLPLKAKTSSSDNILKNVEKCIFTINEEILDHLNTIDRLGDSFKVLKISGVSKDGLGDDTPKEDKPKPSTDFSIIKKWEIGEQLSRKSISTTSAVLS